MQKKKKFILINILLVMVVLLSILDFYKCPLNHLLGLPCMTCGMTRAFLSIIKLDIKKSFYYHALWPLVIISYILYVINEFSQKKFSKKTVKIYELIIGIIFIIYYIIRLIKGSPIVKFNFSKSLIYKIIHIFIK